MIPNTLLEFNLLWRMRPSKVIKNVYKNTQEAQRVQDSLRIYSFFSFYLIFTFFSKHWTLYSRRHLLYHHGPFCKIQHEYNTIHIIPVILIYLGNDLPRIKFQGDSQVFQQMLICYCKIKVKNLHAKISHSCNIDSILRSQQINILRGK